MTDNSREKILSGVRPKTISSKQVIGTDSSVIESLQPVKIINPVLNQCVGRGVRPISVTMLLIYFISNWKLLAKYRRVLEAVWRYHITFMSRPFQLKRPHPHNHQADISPKDQIKAGDWLVKVDHKDAFFTIRIHPSQTKIYQFNCLPFGQSSAPWDFY